MARFNKKSFELMKKQRGLAFLQRHMAVEVDGRKGTVTGDCNGNLAVRFDGNNHSDNCHPHWRVKYYDAGWNLIKEYNN